ncbi:putative hydrolase or acyltransferase of alpha/beta superfamily [Actinobacteria bacterium IMCC26256]|nr:putative hydrolase or acyltransferase of alpha/beta superfamily [Actinobacteria bacterium IMCC26256]
MENHYDEFSFLRDNASEVGLTLEYLPPVKRVFVDVDEGRRLGVIVWGDSDPEIVFIHGGAQNAHTWDTVALALGRSAIAVDLPGHGHSDWRKDRSYWPAQNASDIGDVVERLAPNARIVVGMSLGGLTALELCASHPHTVRELVLVDITPGVNKEKASAITAFIAGPESFNSFDELLERTILYNPTRSESSLRRGVLHNAAPQSDGTWAWRYDRNHLPEGSELPEFRDLWDAVEAVGVRLSLFRGSDSPVVDDADVAELLRRQPNANVVVVEGAGHSIQGDQPVELARLLTEILTD